jgi:hypothetical protein
MRTTGNTLMALVVIVSLPGRRAPAGRRQTGIPAEEDPPSRERYGAACRRLQNMDS